MDIEYKVVEKLIEKGMHIAFAESCTAGLACAKLVNVPDASKVLNVSFTTYADEAKIKYLGVDPETVKQFGVVSEEVAYQMAQGVAAETGSQVGVGITGIAGPTGGVPGKPVGTVCFGIAVNGKVYTWRQEFGDLGRNVVRDVSVNFCYDRLVELLEA
ncbi:MAG: CinA family protein [Eubacterium sp.]|jgi:nicotinamide-nucleotide amidase|nr:CinA family protein [Eubacterium sp.]